MEKLTDFVNDFDVVDNALQMRTLLRWNGRDLRNKENLAEHTHLTVACVLKLLEELERINYAMYQQINKFELIKFAMLHDSFELFSGDILTITKDRIPGLREFIDNEERLFMESKCKYSLTLLESKILRVADLMACYKFIEKEISQASNDFALRAYNETKAAFDNEYDTYMSIVGYEPVREEDVTFRLVKGYKDDAGTDVMMTKRVKFLPMSTTAINLEITCTPKENQMSYLCARTSAANKGLIVAQCPIDPNFTGEVTAIVHNISNHVIEYDVGEAFCQIVSVPILQDVIKSEFRKYGKRSDGKLGSTGGTKC